MKRATHSAQLQNDLGVQGLSLLLPFVLMFKPNFLFLRPSQHLNVKFGNGNWKCCDVSLLQAPDCNTCWDKTLPNLGGQMLQDTQAELLKPSQLHLQPLSLNLNHPWPCTLEAKVSICPTRVVLQKAQVTTKCIQASELFYEELTLIIESLNGLQSN